MTHTPGTTTLADVRAKAAEETLMVPPDTLTDLDGPTGWTRFNFASRDAANGFATWVRQRPGSPFEARFVDVWTVDVREVTDRG